MVKPNLPKISNIFVNKLTQYDKWDGNLANRLGSIRLLSWWGRLKTVAEAWFTMIFSLVYILTLLWRRSLPYRNQSIDLHSKAMDCFLYYRNQSIDLHSKSMDCFLYDRDLRHKRFKNEFLENYSIFQLQNRTLYKNGRVKWKNNVIRWRFAINLQKYTFLSKNADFSKIWYHYFKRVSLF